MTLPIWGQSYGGRIAWMTAAAAQPHAGDRRVGKAQHIAEPECDGIAAAISRQELVQPR